MGYKDKPIGHTGADGWRKIKFHKENFEFSGTARCDFLEKWLYIDQNLDFALGKPVPSRGKSMKSGGDGPITTAGGNPVMSVDQRCISCSGQTATVLAGFKIACLQYMPQPVEFQGSMHDRASLLNRRNELLSHAYGALHSGPDCLENVQTGTQSNSKQHESNQVLPPVRPSGIASSSPTPRTLKSIK